VFRALRVEFITLRRVAFAKARLILRRRDVFIHAIFSDLPSHLPQDQRSRPGSNFLRAARHLFIQHNRRRLNPGF